MVPVFGKRTARLGGSSALLSRIDEALRKLDDAIQVEEAAISGKSFGSQSANCHSEENDHMEEETETANLVDAIVDELDAAVGTDTLIAERASPITISAPVEEPTLESSVRSEIRSLQRSAFMGWRLVVGQVDKTQQVEVHDKRSACANAEHSQFKVQTLGLLLKSMLASHARRECASAMLQWKNVVTLPSIISHLVAHRLAAADAELAWIRNRSHAQDILYSSFMKVAIRIQAAKLDALRMLHCHAKATGEEFSLMQLYAPSCEHLAGVMQLHAVVERARICLESWAWRHLAAQADTSRGRDVMVKSMQSLGVQSALQSAVQILRRPPSGDGLSLGSVEPVAILPPRAHLVRPRVSPLEIFSPESGHLWP